MHILVTANTTWNIWHFRRPVIKALLDDGHHVSVLAPPDETSDNLKAMGCDVLSLEMDAKGLNPIGAVVLSARFHRLLKAYCPDVVLSYTVTNNIFCAIAARTLNIPTIPNVTGLGTAFLSSKPVRLLAEVLYKVAFRAPPIIFFQNQDDLKLFIDRGLARKEQARLLPGSGVDLDHFHSSKLPPSDPEVIFLMVARILKDKGVVEFVEAARAIRADYPSTRFRILGAVGSANRSAVDTDTINAWVAEGVIEILDVVPDVRPEFDEATCVVLPSYREGAPRTLIEAAAMARPIITTNVPGCRSVVDTEVSGFFCEVRSAESLAAAMRRFLELSPEMRAKMGQAGRAKMEREFDEAIVVAAYRDAIRDVTGKR